MDIRWASGVAARFRGRCTVRRSRMCTNRTAAASHELRKMPLRRDTLAPRLVTPQGGAAPPAGASPACATHVGENRG